MPATNDKSPVAAGFCQCDEPCIVCECKPVTTLPEIKPRLTGMFLRALLKRYRDYLLSLPYSNSISILVDCCDQLLYGSSKRAGGGQ